MIITSKQNSTQLCRKVLRDQRNTRLYKKFYCWRERKTRWQ